ncbi:hypothetical protein TcYC6_0010570 [Trypanosoma cruzi]|nr:hypothetical protein TcYC6_0010570 [Trypanosoma cruzi]
MLGLAGGHTQKAVVSTQLVPAAIGARTARCGAPRGPRHRHAHCTSGGRNCGQWAPSLGTLVPALLQKNHAGMVLRQSSSEDNPEERRAGSSELPDNYEAILIGAAALEDTTAAGDADGVTAMKRLCGSVSRAAGKPARPSTTDRSWDILEG